MQITEKIAEDIKDSWVSPINGNLHWDEKLMNTLDSKYKNEERLPVLVSGNLCKLSCISNYVICIFNEI